jgi:hypothetical protein
MLLLGVLGLVLLVVLPTLGFGFVYDDHWVLLDNGFIRDPSNLPLLLGPEASAQHVPDAFRPASVAFETLVYAVLGLWEIGQHAVSVLLYVALCWLIAKWLEGLHAPLPVRIGAVAVFGTMAIHGEAIAVVSYREDLLAAALGMTALVATDRWVDLRARAAGPSREIGLAVLAMVAMMLACASKLSAAPLVVLWALARQLAPWSRPLPPRRLLAGVVLLGLGVAVAVFARVSAVGELSPYGELTQRVYAHRVGLGPVLAASLQIHLEYLRQMFVPGGFSPDYVDYGARWTDPATLLAAGAWLGIVGIGLVAARRRRAPVVALCILGALVLALPTSNLAPMPTMRADRFMLLPSLPVAIGLAAAALWFGRRLSVRAPTSVAALAPLVALIVVQGATLQGATAAYRSDTRLWSVAMHRSPHSARAHGVYGELLVARLQRRPNPMRELNLRVAAATHCELARRFDPLDPIGDLCQGRLLATERRWTEAYDRIAAARQRMEQRRERADLALASLSLDLPEIPYEARVEQSERWLERAAREAPFAAEVYAVSARLHHRLGQPEQAARDYATARAMRPERWDLILAALELQLDLGHASAARDIWSESRTLLRKADPDRRMAARRRLDAARRLFDLSDHVPGDDE